jgi:LuxR family maltose regulon positive regulatory protein
MVTHPTAPLRVPLGKIVVPRLPVEFVPRPTLRHCLDEATAGQVIVVSAPAGSGKTLMLADWVGLSEGPETAWVSLDADDNDPGRLWSAVLTSVLAVPSVARGTPLTAGTDSSAGLPTGAELLEELGELLENLEPPVRVVLDDVHELTDREVLTDLARLIRRRPMGAQFVLASRSDPPISIPRLRLEGRLHELRADLLRFSVEDTAALLTATGRTLTPAQVAVLHARTDGWAAGLRLAALALGRTDDPVAFLTQFSGDERSVAEYLTGEILDSLKPEKQDFLRVVSICSPVPAALAAELSDRPDAERLLDDLRQETALVESTSPGKYRIHPLLRSYLTADLARTRPETYRQSQATAARWWSGRSDPVHALRHAERAGDRDLITELVHSTGVALFLRGDRGPLQRALAAVGAEARTADPGLALTAAITHLDARAVPAALAELDDARRAWPETPDAELDTLRVCAELLATGLGLPVEPLAGPAVPDPTDPAMEALLHASRGIAEFGTSDGADVELARAELQRALALARSEDLGYLEVQAHTMLASLAERGGDYRTMSAEAERAVGAASRRGWHTSAWSAWTSGMLAYAELLAGNPAGAAGQCAESLTTWDVLPPESAYTLHTVHGAGLADQGQRSAGLAEMRSARAEFGDTPGPPSMIAGLGILEHRSALLNGNPEAAAEVADWLAPRIGEMGEVLLLKAWAEAAEGRHEAARTTVRPLLDPGTATLLPHTVVEAHLIEAEAALHADDPDTARRSLEAALATAEALGVARPFALAGPATQQLLSSPADGTGWGPFATRVAAARAAVVADPAALLSEREMAVLALLPSLLNAREIAAEFTVSVNTVKSHIRSIYAKLGVSSRRDAVLQAHERGLLR